MSGTVGTPIEKYKDAHYLTFTVTGTQVTLGNVVYIVSDGLVSPALTTQAAYAIGVAVTAPRVSMTATDDVVAVGGRLTVMTAGVANVTAAAAVTAGAMVQAADTGQVIAATLYTTVIGRALTASTASGDIIQVLLYP